MGSGEGRDGSAGRLSIISQHTTWGLAAMRGGANGAHRLDAWQQTHLHDGPAWQPADAAGFGTEGAVQARKGAEPVGAWRGGQAGWAGPLHGGADGGRVSGPPLPTCTGSS